MDLNTMRRMAMHLSPSDIENYKLALNEYEKARFQKIVNNPDFWLEYYQNRGLNIPDILNLCKLEPYSGHCQDETFWRQVFDRDQKHFSHYPTLVQFYLEKYYEVDRWIDWLLLIQEFTWEYSDKQISIDITDDQLKNLDIEFFRDMLSNPDWIKFWGKTKNQNISAKLSFFVSYPNSNSNLDTDGEIAVSVSYTVNDFIEGYFSDEEDLDEMVFELDVSTIKSIMLELLIQGVKFHDTEGNLIKLPKLR